MGRKPKIQARIDRDTESSLDSFTEDRPDMNQSDAVRHLLRFALAQKGYPVAVADGGSPLERLAAPATMQFASLFGLVAIFGGVVGLAYPSYALLGGVVFLIGLTMTATITTVAALAQLALSRPIRALVGIGSEVKR